MVEERNYCQETGFCMRFKDGVTDRECVPRCYEVGDSKVFGTGAFEVPPCQPVKWRATKSED